MMKKDKDIVYWRMNFKGKFKRTLWFIPIVIIMCFLTPFFMGAYWPVYDVLMIVVLIWQLIYTYRKMKSEEQSDLENQKDK